MNIAGLVQELPFPNINNNSKSFTRNAQDFFNNIGYKENSSSVELSLAGDKIKGKMVVVALPPGTISTLTLKTEEELSNPDIQDQVKDVITTLNTMDKRGIDKWVENFDNLEDLYSKEHTIMKSESVNMSANFSLFLKELRLIKNLVNRI